MRSCEDACGDILLRYCRLKNLTELFIDAVEFSVGVPDKYLNAFEVIQKELEEMEDGIGEIMLVCSEMETELAELREKAGNDISSSGVCEEGTEV